MDLQTIQKWTTFEAPPNFYPDDSKAQYGMNIFSLQLNLLSNELISKLPPTDSRFRPDLRAWENGDVQLASSEKSRLEQNQRERRKQIQEQLKNIDVNQEQTFYSP